ncbi:MAG: hypothetical protein M0R73_12460 [Dehalococcoidia bacterium]|nr:hypothetical protein [Dehalococcoidia bacterium]
MSPARRNTAERGGPQRGTDALALGVASGLTLKDAAARAGLTQRTAERRRAEPGFEDRVQSLRDRVIDTAIGLLAQGAADAARELRRLTTGARSEHARRAAAMGLLEILLRHTSEDALDRRIADLERLAAEAVGSPRDSRVVTLDDESLATTGEMVEVESVNGTEEE